MIPKDLMFATLNAEDVTFDEIPVVVGWHGIDNAQPEGLRVVMTASTGAVSGLLVVTDTDDE